MTNTTDTNNQERLSWDDKAVAWAAMTTPLSAGRLAEMRRVEYALLTERDREVLGI